jgi:hypothetical protein
VEFVPGEPETEEPIGAEQKSSGVAAAAAEAGAYGDPLRECGVDPPRKPPALGKKIPRARQKIRRVPRYRNPSRRKRESLVCGLESDLVFEGDRLEDGVDLVIAVGPSPEDPETEVDLRRAADAERC